jgi:hypothetical protein
LLAPVEKVLVWDGIWPEYLEYPSQGLFHGRLTAYQDHFLSYASTPSHIIMLVRCSWCTIWVLFWWYIG